MDELKNHIGPFVAFGGLGLYALWYVGKSVVAWHRDGSLGVRNRVRWGRGGIFMSFFDLFGSDPTDKRPVHQLKNPAVIVLWLLVCVAFAALCFWAAYNFFRFGHGL